MPDHDYGDDDPLDPTPSAQPEVADGDGAPDAGDAEVWEELYGAEATVPLGDYAPPWPSEARDQRGEVTGEMRELERRLNARLTPAFPIEPRRKLPLEFVWSRYRKFAMRDRSEVVDEFGRDPAYLARVEPMIDFLYRRYFRVEATGLENIPDIGRALIVANHSGTLPWDGAMVMHAVRHEHPARRDLRPLIEDFVFHFPYLGVFINRIGGVRACQENAERLLEADQLAAVFPEGILGTGKLFKDRYRLQRFGRGGFVKLALRTGSPIVPLSIIGAEEANPMLGRITWFAKTIGIPYVPVTPTFPLLGPAGLVPLPTKWRLSFGPLIDLSERYGPEAANDRILVNRLAEEIRSQIQGMIDDSLSRRRSVLFG